MQSETTGEQSAASKYTLLWSERSTESLAEMFTNLKIGSISADQSRWQPFSLEDNQRSTLIDSVLTLISEPLVAPGIQAAFLDKTKNTEIE